MILIAKKPCSFGGKQFYIGDTIPAELVLNPSSQEQMGVLAIMSDEGAGQPVPAQEGQIMIEIPLGEDDMKVSPEDISTALRIMQMPVEMATVEIDSISGGDAATIICLCDQRKTVKAAARKKCAELAEKMFPEE